MEEEKEQRSEAANVCDETGLGLFVKDSYEIDSSDDIPPFPADTWLNDTTHRWPTFGDSVANLGDLDGDGINDIAIGATEEGNRADDHGAVYITLLNADGSPKDVFTIDENTANFGGDLYDFGAGAIAIPPQAERLGEDVESLGDLDGNGTIDIAVGPSTTNSRDYFYIFFLEPDTTPGEFIKIKDYKIINKGDPGSPDYSSSFGATFKTGSAIENLGDFDGDGVVDLAVGTPWTNDGVSVARIGSFYIVLMNADGTPKSSVEIDENDTGLSSLGADDQFGSHIANMGDLDGDGVIDLAVSAPNDDTGASDTGAVYIIYLNSDSSVKNVVKIDSSTANMPTLVAADRFGSSLDNIGDINSDGVDDIIVGANGLDRTNSNSGGAFILTLNSDGTVNDYFEISFGSPNGPNLTASDIGGSSVALIGDIDDNGIFDIALGAQGNGGALREGAMHIIFMDYVDFGDTDDATNTQTLFDDGGAYHSLCPTTGSNPILGLIADNDTDGLPSAAADGDDTDGEDDEDGLYYLDGIAPNATSNVSIYVLTDGILNAWIDFENDGYDAGDQIFTDVALTAGGNDLQFTSPATFSPAPPATANMRLRFDSVGGLSFGGAADDGEVEDYQFATSATIPAEPILDDPEPVPPAEPSGDDGGGRIRVSSNQIVIQNTLLGCTDPSATNYKPSAAWDNGSCLYGLYGTGGPEQPLVVFDDLMEVRENIGFDECDYFSEYLRRGLENDPMEVEKWQKYLNEALDDFDLPITGIFGELTEVAVKSFQSKWAEYVLIPWGIQDPTGYIYKTTRSFGNFSLGCNEGLIFLEGVGPYTHEDIDLTF